MTSRFTTHRRVEFCETDLAGIVHFANFYKYMEQVEHEFFRTLGLSVMKTLDDGSILGWPRVSASCNFKAPAYFEDVLEVRLSVARKGVKSLTIEYEFVRGDVLVAVGSMKTVCCRFRYGSGMESIAIPPEYDQKISERTAGTENDAG